MLIDSVSIYKNDLTFDDAENIILKAKKLVNDYYYVDEMLANLYIDKGDALESAGNFNQAYIYYNKAQKTYSDANIRLLEKYRNLVEKLISQGNTALNNQEYPLAIQSFEFALDIDPNKKDELEELIDDLYTKLSIEESMQIKQNIQTVVQEKKEEIENSFNKKILIGMSIDDVENALGLPNLKDIIEKGGRKYELWTYKYPEKIKRIYFENNLVIKVE